MRSVLLAIGCDRYTDFSPLDGAEADARRVFSALTASGQPYRASDSRLLLSPTLQQLEECLRQIATGDAVDVLTLYFAGHGGIGNGSYYFCLQDTATSLLSITGFPLQRWLSLVKDLRPRFGYVIADSCNSGGAHLDIHSLLSDPRVGYHEASTFVCLAASSADQYATETKAGGLMTTELLKIFDGQVFVGTDRPELDLLDVARVVNEQVVRVAPDQRPVTWGLNLFGAGRLCRNPHFTAGPFVLPPLDPAMVESIRRHSEALWQEYREAGQGPRLGRLRDLVYNVTQTGSPSDTAALVQSLANGFVSRMEARQAPWESAELLGVFAAFLLPQAHLDKTAAAAARALLVRKFQWEGELIGQTLQDLTKDGRLFLRGQSAVAEYFYLPLRLTKFIAVVAHATAFAPKLGVAFDPLQARALIGKILEAYPNAFRTVSDQQAPYLYVWCNSARALGWTVELETVFGCMFSDLVAAQGRPAREGLEPRVACEYALARGANLPLKPGWVANPSALLAVALLAAGENGLADAVDPYLELLDHRRLSLYFPSDYSDFAQDRMEEGINRTHEIGHDIWKTDDFMQLFREHWRRHEEIDRLPADDVEQSLAVQAALAFTDRVPLGLQRA